MVAAIINKDLFEYLLEEANNLRFYGWDWSVLAGRVLEKSPTWSYLDIVRNRMQFCKTFLDIGTGGGELLSTLRPFPHLALATESYPPNVSIAGSRLIPLGVHVIAVDEALPFPFSSQSFDLIANRHAGYHPPDLYRILRPDGHFITQQVGGSNCIGLNQLIQEHAHFIYSYWTLKYATDELLSCGFVITDQREEYPEVTFTDIGAVVSFLKIISWQIEDFSTEKYFDQLVNIHNMIQENGPLTIHQHRFLIEANKRPDVRS